MYLLILKSKNLEVVIILHYLINNTSSPLEAKHYCRLMLPPLFFRVAAIIFGEKVLHWLDIFGQTAHSLIHLIIKLFSVRIRLLQMCKGKFSLQKTVACWFISRMTWLLICWAVPGHVYFPSFRAVTDLTYRQGRKTPGAPNRQRAVPTRCPAGCLHL